jgi:hypothetical protein
MGNEIRRLGPDEDAALTRGEYDRLRAEADARAAVEADDDRARRERERFETLHGSGSAVMSADEPTVLRLAAAELDVPDLTAERAIMASRLRGLAGWIERAERERYGADL